MKDKPARILIIDDDEMFCELLSDALKAEGHLISVAHCLEDGLRIACADSLDVVFLDVRLPDGNGLDKLAEIRGNASAPEVIILTGAGTADGAELAIKSGAWDYIQKPSSISSMTLPLIRALQFRQEKNKKKPSIGLKLNGIIGQSAPMKACYDLVCEASMCDAGVLITGETGTGKELFARAIHENSSRSGQGFIIVDCAALTQSLTESTLFGYEKGAFTGADSRRDGLIKQADGGTLFLDEIGELPPAVQKSFLRVLQERRFRPLGSAKEIDSDFRLIAATHRNLEELVRKGLFREDLLFRIRSITLNIPPLRDHAEDLHDIALFHTTRICRRSRIAPKKLSDDFIEALSAYSWPGNVRELVNAIERAVAAALTVPTLFARHLPSAIRVKLARDKAKEVPVRTPPTESKTPLNVPRLKDLREATYADVEKKYLADLLKATGGDIEEVCRIADLKRTRLYEILRKHRIPIK